MTGLEAPPKSRNLEVKPYLVGNMTTDKTVVADASSNDPGGDFGADAKYGVTQSLTADLTYNTDFAQVEADEQQVNLTRFSLFFPEKRDFFLENQGIFTFGGAGGSDRRTRGGAARSAKRRYCSTAGASAERATRGADSAAAAG